MFGLAFLALVTFRLDMEDLAGKLADLIGKDDDDFVGEKVGARQVRS